MKGVTPYQLELLKLVKAGAAGDGVDAIDFDQLLDRLSWKPTKQSAQFTIRACITKGFISKGDLQLRRGRKRVTYLLTKNGKLVLDPRPELSKPLPFVPGLSLEENKELLQEADDAVFLP